MRILIHGYDNINLGDDLFFRILSTRYPDVDFMMISDNDYEKIVDTPNIRCVKNNILNKICRKLNIIPYQLLFESIDAVVVIGGSIFMEVESTGSCGAVTNIQRYKKWLPKTPIYIIGSNYGPARTSIFENSVENVFRIADSICLRDSYSFDIFKKNSKVRYASDVVFQLPRQKRNGDIYNTIGISLINLENRQDLKIYKNCYIKLIKDIIDKALCEKKYIKLFSFCENEGDYVACSEILGLYDRGAQDNIDIVAYTGNIGSFLEEFSKIDKLYATRYHAVILGLLYQIPTLPLVYSDKILYALNDIGCNIPYIDIRKQVYEDINLLRAYVLENDILDTLVSSSNNQFKSLDSLLLYEN